MRLPDGLDRAVRLAEQEGVLGPHPGVGGVRIPRPLQVAGAASVVRVHSPVAAGRLEALRGVVRDQHHDPAGTAVRARRADRLPQVVLREHVVDRVVHEHGVERAAQPNGAHVTQQVLAARVEPPRHLQHLPRQVHQRHREPPGQEVRVVPAATAELQHVVHRP